MQRRTWLLVTMQWSSYLTLMHPPQASSSSSSSFIISYLSINEEKGTRLGFRRPDGLLQPSVSVIDCYQQARFGATPPKPSLI
jgi:hypothetical protein